MLHQMSGLSLKSPLRLFTALVFHLLLIHSCKGQNQLIGSSQPIVATVGDDIILPCHLKPAVDVTKNTLEWTRPDLNPTYVHIWYMGLDLVHTQHPSYKGRTSLITEELKHGNISLKLSKVKLSDEGTYQCHMPFTNNQSLVELVVGAASSPDIRVAGIDTSSSRVVLQCESKGWYPEPEVFWLDGERKLLSAGPTETVRGPDDLYTVISRVTVEKRHSNSFTCRVQQNHINQIRETHFIVPDKLLIIQSDSGVSINSGLAVSLAVCILLIFAVVFFVWSQNKRKKTRSCMDKTKRAESNETKMQVAKAAERKSLMKTQRVSENNKETKCFNDQQQLQQQRREEVGNKVENVKIKTQHDELQRLRSELETKKKELQERQNPYTRFSRVQLFSTNEQLWKVEEEVKTLDKKLQDKQDKFDIKIKQYNKLLELEKNMDQEVENMDQEPENMDQEVENMDQEPENMKIKTQYAELQRLRSELETKKKKEEIQNHHRRSTRKRKKNEQLEKAEKEVETLEKKLKTKQDEFDMKTKQLEERQNSYKRFLGKRKKNEQLEQVEGEVETPEKKLKTEFDNIKQ